MLSVDRFTTGSQEVARRAAEIMQRHGHHQVGTEHLLLALIEQPRDGISPLLESLNVDAQALSEKLDTLLRTVPGGEIVELGPGQVSISPGVAHILQGADEEAGRMNDEHISPGHIFLVILDEHDTPAARLLEEAGLTRDRVYDAFQDLRP